MHTSISLVAREVGSTESSAIGVSGSCTTRGMLSGCEGQRRRTQKKTHDRWGGRPSHRPRILLRCLRKTTMVSTLRVLVGLRARCTLVREERVQVHLLSFLQARVPRGQLRALGGVPRLGALPWAA